MQSQSKNPSNMGITLHSCADKEGGDTVSHVTTIDASEKYDIPSLKQMCKNEGWEFLENKTTFAWFGRHVGDYPIPKGFTVNDMGK